MGVPTMQLLDDHLTRTQISIITSTPLPDIARSAKFQHAHEHSINDVSSRQHVELDITHERSTFNVAIRKNGAVIAV